MRSHSVRYIINDDCIIYSYVMIYIDVLAIALLQHEFTSQIECQGAQEASLSRSHVTDRLLPLNHYYLHILWPLL